ncbi:MAG: SWIM zinc finger family protein [Clostridia bacterium]|nr:SWIM zinc finger family protein [Clostridia bacterium]
MGKEVIIPQGTYKVGRDLPAGVYLVSALNDLSFVTIDNENDDSRYDHYSLDDDNTKQCRFEVLKGDTLKIEGKAKIKRVTEFAVNVGNVEIPRTYSVGTNESVYIGKTISDQWNININKFYDNARSRLYRGSEYMRNGKVQNLLIGKGIITAQVCGSENTPYNVTIRIATTNNSKNLLPTKEQISFECDCPDSAKPCKHIAAVLYSVANELKENPYVLNYLRNVPISK